MQQLEDSPVFKAIKDRRSVREFEDAPVAVTRHILPNCMDPVFVRMPVTAAGAILMLAGLSFIGLGAQPPTPE